MGKRGIFAKFQVLAAVTAAVLVCSVAEAQVRSGTGSPSASSGSLRVTGRAKSALRGPTPGGHAPTPLASSPKISLIQIPPSGLVASEFAPASNLFSSGGVFGVPGLGFGFPHRRGTPGAENSPSRSGKGHQGQGPFTSVLLWGYPYYPDQGADQPDQAAAPADQTQQQDFVNQQTASSEAQADSGGDGAYAAPISETAEAVATPDLSNFVLVRRDGRLLFASVFSVVGTQLQYVTPEGIRRTLAMADLDLDATQQMNEARGTSVQFRN